MNYKLTISAQVDGGSLSELNKAVELITSMNGVALETFELKPVDAPTIIVAKSRRRGSYAYSTDPRIVYKPGGIKGTSRVIDVEASCANLKLNPKQLIENFKSFKEGSTEFRVARAIQRRNGMNV